MAIIRTAVTVKNNILTQIKNAIDAGTGAGTIKVYTGSMPAAPETAITTQTLLGTLTCSDPCGTVASGTLTFGAVTQDSSADATGVAAWARIADSDATAVHDVDITTTGGGGTLQLNTTNIVAGGPILCSSLTVTVP